MNDWIDGCMDEWMNAQANGCMDGCINCHTPFPFPFYPLHPLAPPLNPHPLQPSPHNHPSTPSLRPFKYHSLTGASLPHPRPTANTRNKYNIHQRVCIADGLTSSHFTPTPNPSPLHFVQLPYSFHAAPNQSIPSHPTSVGSGQFGPAWQADKEASRRTCRKASMQACKHVVYWVFMFFIAMKITFILIQT